MKQSRFFHTYRAFLFFVTVIIFAVSLHAGETTAITARDSTSGTDTIVVYGSRKIVRDTLSVTAEQRKTGRTDDINTILSLQKSVQRVPEAGSSLIIRGGSPYENTYLVNGVPMIEPSHFPGHSFADRNGLMAMAVRQIALLPWAAGRYGGSRNALSLQSGIIKQTARDTLRHPELLLYGGTLDYGLSAVLPVRDTGTWVQVTARNANSELMYWKSTAFGNGNYPMSPFVWSDSASLGYSIPYSYGDITITGERMRNKTKIQGFGWYAYDYYDTSRYRGSLFVPWGMGSLTIDRLDGSGFKFGAGGSRQVCFSGKKMGPVTPLTKVQRSDAACFVERRLFASRKAGLTAGMRGEVLDWEGSLKSYWTRINGMASDSVASFSAAGREGKCETNAAFRYGIEHGLEAGSNLLAGIFMLNGNAVPYMDPSLSLNMTRDESFFSATIGGQTLRPDIRGLPGSHYRERTLRTWSAAVEYSRSVGAKFNGSIEGYSSWMGRCPRFSNDPAMPVWDPDRETALLTLGGSLIVDAAIVKNRLSARIVQDINRSERIAGDTVQPYEWDIPWSTSVVLKCTASKSLDVFVKGMFAAGLPYQTPVLHDSVLVFGDEFHRVPAYRRVDLQILYSRWVRVRRFTLKYEGYLELLNFLNAFDGMFGPSQWFWENTREYYWDDRMRQRPLLLEYATIAAGLKIGFGL